MSPEKLLLISLGTVFVIMGLVTITSRKAETEETWKKRDVWFKPRGAVYDRRNETYKRTKEHTGLDAVLIGVGWTAAGLFLLFMAFKVL